IQKHVACHKLNTLYSSSGEVNLDVLQEMLADNKQVGNGWVLAHKKNHIECSH
ncbi:hypothetical protein XENOCAPTIV_018608, partial [Xenoophorus captivus]